MNENRTPDTLILQSDLESDLRHIGVRAGMTLFIHSSLRQIAGENGWICGGVQAVIEALTNVLTPDGTLIMPTHSTDWTDPQHWQAPPLPPEWWQTVYEQMPAYRPDITPTRKMGILAETFRKMDGVVRSQHPAYSVAAWGQHREFVVNNHALSTGMGDRSPLARIYDLDGWVLLLGVGHANNTSLHLSEYRADWRKPYETAGGAIYRNGKREWATYKQIDWDPDDFEQIGAAFEAVGGVALGWVGSAETRLMRQQSLVDFGITWIEENRPH